MRFSIAEMSLTRGSAILTCRLHSLVLAECRLPVRHAMGAVATAEPARVGQAAQVGKDAPPQWRCQEIRLHPNGARSLACVALKPVF